MFSFLYSSIFWYAAGAGISIAITAGLLGQFVVSKRISHVSDGVSHIALVGVFLSALLPVNGIVAILIVCACAGLVLEYMLQKKSISSDAGVIMMIIASLSIIGVLQAFVSLPFSLESALFGSIVSLTTTRLLVIVSMCTFISLFVVSQYRSLTQMVILGVSSRTRGVPYSVLSYVFMITVSLFIGMSVQLVGGLLVSGLLVIPVLIAQHAKQGWYLSHVLAVMYAVFAVFVGLCFAWIANIAPGVAVSCILIVLYIVQVFSKMLIQQIL